MEDIDKQKPVLTVNDFYESEGKKLDLKLVAGKNGLKREIYVPELNRPGLALAGYYDYFAKDRIQVLGKVEISYLKTFTKDLRRERICALLDFNVPCVIIARRYKPPEELIELADEKNVPLFRSSHITMNVINLATGYLESVFAPHMTIHGVLAEVFGIGVLIQGISGVGKSECALSLVVRGHRLISDDLVQLKLLGGNRILGLSHEIGKHHMELRGLGIINIQTLFGAGRIMNSKELELAITLEEWRAQTEYDRLGLDEKTTTIFGVDIPHIILPVRPGRDMAMLVEVAALNHRLIQQGYHAADEFQSQLLQKIQSKR